MLALIGNNGGGNGFGGLHQRRYDQILEDLRRNTSLSQRLFRLLHGQEQPRILPEAGAEIPVQLLQQAAVLFQQTQRQPAGRKPLAIQPAQSGAKGPKGRFHRVRVTHDGRRQGSIRLHDLLPQGGYLCGGAFSTGGAAGNRYPQLPLQRRQIDADMQTAGFIHQVDADHRAGGDLQRLQHKVQVALQAGGVAYHAYRIGGGKTQEIAGDLLLRRVCHQ